MSEPKRKTIDERLADFYARLAALPSARSGDEAFQQLCETLEAVEDEFSGVPKQEPPPFDGSDGRMYVPQADFTVRGADGSIRSRTKGHLVEIASSGSIVVQSLRTGLIEFTKQGFTTE